VARKQIYVSRVHDLRDPYAETDSNPNGHANCDPNSHSHSDCNTDPYSSPRGNAEPGSGVHFQFFERNVFLECR